MSLFGKRKKKERLAVVFDVGSASVGGALVNFTEGENPRILFVVREDIAFQERAHAPRLHVSMEKALAGVAASLAAEAKKRGVSISTAEVSLASPWYASQTRIVHYARDVEFLVTERGIGKLIDREIALFRESNSFTKKVSTEEPPQIVEAKTVSVSLNGYSVRHPFGKRARELDFALYISMLPAHTLSAVKDILSKEWISLTPHYSSFAFATFDTIRDIFADETGFIFMDISGEATDVSIVGNGILLESVSFPFGTRTLVRAALEKRSGNIVTTESDLVLYLEGQMSGPPADEMEKIFDDAVGKWSDLFYESLSKFAEEFPIPRVVFYTVDDAYGGIFEAASRRIKLGRLGSDEHSFALRRLGMKFLGKFISSADGVPEDPFLAIGTLAARKVVWSRR